MLKPKVGRSGCSPGSSLLRAPHCCGVPDAGRAATTLEPVFEGYLAGQVKQRKGRDASRALCTSTARASRKCGVTPRGSTSLPGGTDGVGPA